MDFLVVLDQVIDQLRQRGRLTYRTLKRQFELDDEALEDLKEELIYGQRLAVDEETRVLVWAGGSSSLVKDTQLETDKENLQAYEQSDAYQEMYAPTLSPFFAGEYTTHRCEVKYSQ